MSDSPAWAEELVDAIEGCMEWYGGPGGKLDVRYSTVEHMLFIAPAVEKIVGGQHDGEEVYGFYSVDFSELASVFDAAPSMSWNTMHDELIVEGQMDGQRALAMFQKHPFSYAEPDEVIDERARGVD